ncbi:IS66 family transposase [Tritonibacter scottomollicae]|uniref:IS66 family transposase n=1 Tax=Tritonibacter scottomollicae TaxID=483013 RepID=UPI003AA902FE
MTIQEPGWLPGQQEVDAGELSPIGLLCDGILSAISQLPSNPEEATVEIGTRISNILSLFSETEFEVRSAKRRISALKSDLRRVTEQLAVLRQEHFGQSSEKNCSELPEEDLGFALEDEFDEEPKEKPKGKRARKVPKDIKVITVDHFPDDMSCRTCGDNLKSIKRELRVGKFRIVPEHLVLVNDAYHTCACNREICKENKPVAAKSRNYIMKGRGMEPEFAAEAACQKFFEHIPPYRLERRFRNANINLARQTIDKAVAHLAKYLRPIQEELHAHVLSGHTAQMDETPVKVQAPGKGRCDTGYFWVINRDEANWNSEAQPAVVYRYAHSRAGEVAEELLSGASLRFLQTDGYAGYNRLFKDNGQNDGLMPSRCNAHARRKFFEAHLATKSKLAAKVVQMYRKMYAVEKAAKGLPPAEREKLRLEKTLPIMTKLKAILTKHQDDASGKLKTAITYTLNGFDGLQRFVFDGRLEIDNNGVERCIRGVALTKKNSLFVGSHEVAEVWATYYSLIESARLNKVNPRSYLNWLVQEIERSRGMVDYSQLMPWHCPVGRIDE